MKVRDALVAAARRLARTSETPRLDAELLMAEALGTDRDALLLSCLEREAPAGFEELLARREAGEPVAYILRRRAFWTIELMVEPGVLIPRPDSETLIEAALAHFGNAGPRNVLDLGTGSGALLLAALDQWQDARGLGIDRSEKALAIASANARLLGMEHRTAFRCGDWGEGLAERFDLILSNAPHVEEGAQLPQGVAEWEPHQALFAGADGLADYRRIVPVIPGLLSKDGIACIEIGAGQEADVSLLFAKQGLNVSSRKDLAGHTRCLIVRL